MDRHNLDFPGELTPDEDAAEAKLIQETGNRHEERFLEELRARNRDITKIDMRSANPETQTRAAVAPVGKIEGAARSGTLNWPLPPSGMR